MQWDKVVDRDRSNLNLFLKSRVLQKLQVLRILWDLRKEEMSVFVRRFGQIQTLATAGGG